MAAKTKTSAKIQKKCQNTKKPLNIYDVAEPGLFILRIFQMAVYKIDPITHEMKTSCFNFFIMCGVLIYLMLCLMATIFQLIGFGNEFTKNSRLTYAGNAWRIINIYFFSCVLIVLIKNFKSRKTIGKFLSILEDFDIEVGFTQNVELK